MPGAHETLGKHDLVALSSRLLMMSWALPVPDGAAAVAWAIERLRRHPRLASRLTAEVDAGGSELRQATI